MSVKGMMTTVMVTELIDAVIADEAGDGIDISAGLIGVNTSDWIRGVASELSKMIKLKEYRAAAEQGIGQLALTIDDDGRPFKTCQAMTRLLADLDRVDAAPPQPPAPVCTTCKLTVEPGDITQVEGEYWCPSCIEESRKLVNEAIGESWK